MSATKPARAARGTVQHGLLAQCVLCVPVDKKDLKAQLAVEEAFVEATSTGDLSRVLTLPGVRLARTDRPHRFGPLPKTTGPETADNDAGTAPGETAEEDAEEAQDGEGEASANGRGRRRAA